MLKSGFLLLKRLQWCCVKFPEVTREEGTLACRFFVLDPAADTKHFTGETSQTQSRPGCTCSLSRSFFLQTDAYNFMKGLRTFGKGRDNY